MTMTEALRNALAYTHICGYMPKNIHITTWSKIREMTEGPSIKTRVKDEFLSEISDHPFVVGHKFMTDRGFLLSQPYHKRGTSHHIRYTDNDLNEGVLYRSGGASFYYRQKRNGSYSENVKQEDIR